MKCFSVQVAEVNAHEQPAIADKLRRASPHWMRHTHTSHALERSVELTAARDNMRQASILTTSLYLNSDEEKRAR